MSDREEIQEVGPPRDDELADEPLGQLPADKPAYDTAMGAEPAMPPEVPKGEKMDESETATPQ
jgi:hypothetical protein